MGYKLSLPKLRQPQTDLVSDTTLLFTLVKNMKTNGNTDWHSCVPVGSDEGCLHCGYFMPKVCLSVCVHVWCYNQVYLIHFVQTLFVAVWKLENLLPRYCSDLFKPQLKMKALVRLRLIHRNTHTWLHTFNVLLSCFLLKHCFSTRQLEPSWIIG